MKRSALMSLVSEIKSETKAERSASETLKKIIDDYCKTDEFRKYLQTHRAEAGDYLEDATTPPGEYRYRASSAGKCLQAQAFKVVAKQLPLPLDKVVRSAENQRALYNGTFMHMRYHMMFDALHEKGIVFTHAKEERHYDAESSVTGGIDRLIEFDYAGGRVSGVIDMKSIKSFNYGRLVQPEAAHEAQQACYRLLGFNADRWFMLYEDKDTHALKIYDLPYREGAVDDLRARYKRADEWIEAYIQSNQLPKLELDTQWCNWCEYQTVCGLVNVDAK